MFTLVPIVDLDAIEYPRVTLKPVIYRRVVRAAISPIGLCQLGPIVLDRGRSDLATTKEVEYYIAFTAVERSGPSI
jgi:hypothetical protein